MRRLITLFAIMALFLTFSNEAISQDTPKVQLDTTIVKRPDIYKNSEHLLGFDWSYSITGVTFAPDLNSKGVNTYKNAALLYTYYHSMWGVWPYFGLQIGVRYNEKGFTNEFDHQMDAIFSTVEVPFTAAFKVDASKRLRFMLNIGGFAGYRLNTNVDGGFDCFDRRVEYGVMGGGGIALKFHPFELHIGAAYHYSLSMLYYPEKLTSAWWLYSNPHEISLNVGIHFNFN